MIKLNIAHTVKSNNIGLVREKPAKKENCIVTALPYTC